VTAPDRKARRSPAKAPITAADAAPTVAAAPPRRARIAIASLEIEGDPAAVTEGVVALFDALKNALSKGGK
jgi:hypothetical protein